MISLHRLLLVVLSFVLATAVTAAATRQYADNQRNWLVIAAVLAAFALAALLFARPVGRAIFEEWRPRR
ncbi:MAG: hypothetical protein LH469_00110 [Frankiaceae bacterium]|nr:hypothetical protein [Frankiaceae bacterium]